MKKGQIIVLSGGVGGAKLVLGLSHVLASEKLLVVTNTGDDFEHLGLTICPDTDTALYTLAGLSDAAKGWGRANETWTFMQALAQLGGPAWFNLGDGDLALHVLRTTRLSAGATLTEVTQELANIMGLEMGLIPMSNDPVSTQVKTTDGMLAFQHYFVREQCRPQVQGFEFQGLEKATPNAVLLDTLEQQPEAIIIAPSNPFVSIDPIIRLPGLMAKLKASGAPIIAVSPIVAGQAIKGPAAKMMTELGMEVSALSVANHYQGLVDGMIIDHQDKPWARAIEDLGMAVKLAPTVMHDLATRVDLAANCIEYARLLGGRHSD